ncbi:MAG: efflux RND transporter periplasmic adaptor subunit, partial [Vicinamibacterales bacterium]|nr:efflux RND transporter periplasmic adaptor subunit [Vicinamibacterales bacterium]
MLRSVVRASSVVGLALLVSFASPGAVEAQFGAGPSPVRYTEAQAHTMRRSVQLPGTVESASMSIVASEMAGLVTELPAREGMAVSQGDILASLRSTNLELRMQATESELREAEARAQLAERELERARDLFADELFSQQQLDGAEFEFNARIGKQAQLEADLAVLQDDLERSVIRAPFDGVVVDEQTEVGQWLTVGGPVVELHALSRLEVVVEVPERYFGAIERGTVATVQVGSLDGLEVEGRVNAIIPRASTQARTFPVKVRIDNSKSRIGVGMLTQVAFPIGESYDAVVVPKDALVLRGPQRFVYVIG